ncbi:MAG TPA: hypothetical protein PK861_10595, partial [Thermomonas sp.]|nr:hypothetical protein [Thermomonas sp.]
MRKFRLTASACAAALLAGCAGPATRPDAVVARPVVPAATPTVAEAPVAMPMPPTMLDRIRRLAPALDPGV